MEGCLPNESKNSPPLVLGEVDGGPSGFHLGRGVSTLAMSAAGYVFMTVGRPSDGKNP